MISRRRLLGQAFRATAVASFYLASVAKAKACLYGSYLVVCSKGHVDRVDQGTCQHKCETCGEQVFRGAKVTLRCPNGHSGEVDSSVCGRACEGVNCGTCGANCRIG